MHTPYSREFRDYVVRVAWNRELEVRIEQIATDVGVHTATLQKWLHRSVVDVVSKPGPSLTQGAGLREGRKRMRLLEHENEVLR